MDGRNPCQSAPVGRQFVRKSNVIAPNHPSIWASSSFTPWTFTNPKLTSGCSAGNDPFRVLGTGCRIPLKETMGDGLWGPSLMPSTSKKSALSSTLVLLFMCSKAIGEAWFGAAQFTPGIVEEGNQKQLRVQTDSNPKPHHQIHPRRAHTHTCQGTWTMFA